MTSDIRWSLPSDGHTFPIYAGPTEDMDRVAEFADERGVAHLRFGGDAWSLTRPDQGDGTSISATTPTGEWTARGDSPKFGKSTKYTVQADRHVVTIIAESRSDFVLDIDGEKAGQYTSANRGLRNLHVEFEGPGQKLPLDVQVFLSWVARETLAARTISSGKAWVYTLLFCVVIAVLYWIGFF